MLTRRGGFLLGLLLMLPVAATQAQKVIPAMVDADAAPTFTIEARLSVPPETVWHALTRKAVVDRYYLAPLGADIRSAGSKIFYGAPDRELIVGTVTIFEPPRRLQHTFRFTDEADRSLTTVTYSLAQSGTGTVLRIDHAGYARDSQGWADVSGGWPIIVAGLKRGLDAGR